MARQLALLESSTDWRLDERTREIGRKGVAEARAVLRSALAEPNDGDNDRQRAHRTAA